jgi:glutaredoxin
MDKQEVVVYSKSSCPMCVITKGRLEAKGISFTEVLVDKDATARQMLIDAGHRSVPVIFADGAPTKLEDLLA